MLESDSVSSTWQPDDVTDGARCRCRNFTKPTVSVWKFVDCQTNFPLWPDLRVGRVSPFSVVATFERRWDCDHDFSDIYPVISAICQQGFL